MDADRQLPERPILSGPAASAPWPTVRAAWRPRGWFALVCLALFALITADLFADGFLPHIDQAIAAAMTHLDIRHRPVIGVIGYVLTQTGGRGPNLILLLLLSGMIAFEQRTFAPLVRALLATGLLSLIMLAAKPIFGRTAPAYGADLLHNANGMSFPSGHQANAILLSAVGAWIAADYVRQLWLRRCAFWYAIIAPIIASISVLLMNYHWLSDIIAGACLGVCLLWMLRAVFASKVGMQFERALGSKPTSSATDSQR